MWPRLVTLGNGLRRRRDLEVIMMRWLMAVLGVAFVASASVPGVAKTVCGDRDTFLARLGNTYSEQPVAMGLTSDGTVMEVLTSDTGTWTILVTYPNGRTCMVAAGDSWEPIALPASGRSS